MERKTNYLALIACPVYNALLGMGWYSIFRIPWMMGHGMTKDSIEHMANPALPYIVSFSFALVSAFLLNGIFRRMNVSGWLDGLKTGVTIGLFCLMSWIVMILFALHPIDLALIDGGYAFFLFTGYGLIIGGWQKK
jgi:hypothetical protein